MPFVLSIISASALLAAGCSEVSSSNPRRKQNRSGADLMDALRARAERAHQQGLRIAEWATGVLPDQAVQIVVKQPTVQAIDAESEDSDQQRGVDRVLKVASANLIVGAASIAYPPLLWLTVPGILYAMFPFYRLAWQGLREGRINSYVLDAILMTGVIATGYFYTLLIVCWVMMVGRKLLLLSEDHSKASIGNLFGEQIQSVWILTDDGIEVQIPFDELCVGNTIIVGAGQMIPADGIIVSGLASIDQRQLTGESNPAEKGPGDEVLASTLVLSGTIHLKAERTGEQTTARRVGEILTQTADYKASIQSRGERIADQATPIILGLSTVFLYSLGPTAALAVLTNTFGYKMRLFAPATMLTYLDIASRSGILIKDGRTLEILNEVDVVVFDKTGTLTEDRLVVKAIHTEGDVSEEDLLRISATAESRQNHPISHAIIDEAVLRQLSWGEPDEAKVELGFGLCAKIDGRTIQVGSARFMALSGLEVPAGLTEVQEASSQAGTSMVFVSVDRQVVGAIELQSSVRPEAQRVASWLRGQNIETYILSGDHEDPTRSMAMQLGVDGYYAEVLPSEKASFIKHLQDKGHTVCFVGDGINDSIALKQANVSVSMSGATTAATDTAQIVLMDGTLEHFEQLFHLSRRSERNLRVGLFLSTVPSLLCIGGIIFLSWGIITAYSITLSVLFAGIGNSTAPSIRAQLRGRGRDGHHLAAGAKS